MRQRVSEPPSLGGLFFTLFRWDYLTDFSDQPVMVFMRCFHWKRTRQALFPLMQFVWQYTDLRKAVQHILTSHIVELETKHASCVYLAKPFVYLAFTGSAYDYKNTMCLLEACAKTAGAQPAARYLADSLFDELKKREASLEE